MLTALNDKIIVQDLKKEKSKGGLIIPDTVQQPQAFGVVVSIGDKVIAPVELGQVLVFHTSGGMAMVVEGKILRCLMEGEVYAIVEDKEIIDSLTLCEIKQTDLDALDTELKKAQGQAANAGKSRIVRV
jgi:co-chaperonin GroES (HSP10)